MKHLINWIEIPAKELKRAINFYSSILDIDFHEMSLGESTYAIFPNEDKFNSGALVQGPYHQPAENGVLIYLDGGSDLTLILSKVKAAGGEVIMEKMFLSKDAGFIGMFVDSEGNHIGLQHM